MSASRKLRSSSRDPLCSESPAAGGGSSRESSGAATPIAEGASTVDDSGSHVADNSPRPHDPGAPLEPGAPAGPSGLSGLQPPPGLEAPAPTEEGPSARLSLEYWSQRLVASPVDLAVLPCPDCAAAGRRVRSAELALAQVQASAARELLLLARQLDAMSRLRDDLQAGNDARVQALEATVREATADLAAAKEFVAVYGAVKSAAVEASERASAAQNRADESAAALLVAQAEVESLRGKLASLSARLPSPDLSPGAVERPSIPVELLAAGTPPPAGEVSALASLFQAHTRDAGSILDRVREPHQSRVEGLAADLRASLGRHGVDPPVAALLASGAAAEAVGAFPESPIRQVAVAESLVMGQPVLPRPAVQGGSAPDSLATLTAQGNEGGQPVSASPGSPPRLSSGPELQRPLPMPIAGLGAARSLVPPSGDILGASSLGIASSLSVRRGLGLGLGPPVGTGGPLRRGLGLGLGPPAAGECGGGEGGSGEGGGGASSSSSGGSGSSKVGAGTDSGPPALRPREVFLGLGALPADRVAAPSRADGVWAPAGFSAQRVADGTPVAAMAESLRVIAQTSEHQYQFTLAKDQHEQHELDEKQQRQAKDSLTFLSPSSVRRVYYMHALGAGDTSEAMAPALTVGVYTALSRRFHRHKENYGMGIHCVMTRRIVYALSAGQLGSGPRALDACDIKLLTKDSMLTEPAVDFSVSKVEPRGDDSAQDAVQWFEAVKMLAKLIGMRFGRSYYEVGLLAFADQLWSRYIEDPAVWTLPYIKRIFTNCLDKFTWQVDQLVSDLEEISRAAPGGDQPLTLQVFHAILVAPGASHPTPTAFSRLAPNHLDDVAADRREHVDRLAAKQATAAGAGTLVPVVPRREGAGGGRASGSVAVAGPLPEPPAENDQRSILTPRERKLGFEALSRAAGHPPPSPGVCVKASTHKLCPGSCGRLHQAITADMVADLPYQAHAILVELGGLLTSPVIPSAERRGRIEVLREAAGDRAAGGIEAASFFSTVLSDSHTLEAPLRAALTENSIPEHLFTARPPDPVNRLAEAPCSLAEALAARILAAVRPIIGATAPPEISAWAAAFVAARLGPLGPADAGFTETCHREVLAGLRRMATEGVPRLRHFAHSVLPEHRAGGSSLQAFFDGFGPSVLVYPTEAGSGGTLPAAAVLLFDVWCTAVELGDAVVCNGCPERSQCLILTCAAGCNDDPGRLLQLLRAQAEAALSTASSEPSVGAMPVAYAAALGAAHDLCSGHSHDCHSFLYFWPRSDPRYSNTVIVLVKVASGGRTAIDVLDLRLDPTTPPNVIAGLLLDGHARPLQLPAQWQDEAGLSALLSAAHNRGIMVERYPFVGVAAARADTSGVVMERQDRTRCEFCGCPFVRSSLCCMADDVAGRAALRMPFEMVHPDLLEFARRAAKDEDDVEASSSDSGSAGLKDAGLKVDGGSPAACESSTLEGGWVHSNKGAVFENISFNDIMRYKPSAQETALAVSLVALAREPVNDEREVITKNGPARQKFLSMFRQVVRTWDSLIMVCNGSYRKAALVFRHHYLLEMPATMDAERFDRVVAPLVPPDLAAYGRIVQAEGVRIRLKRRTEVVTERLAAPPSPEVETEVMVEIFKDFSRGGLIAASRSLEAQKRGVFDDVQASPLLRVPKKNMDGTESEEGRIVHHQSFPQGSSTNDATALEKHPPSRPPSHVTLIRITLLTIASNPGLEIRFAKRDAKAAFKRCFLQLGCINWFASTIRGRAIGIPELLVVIWLTLTFGFGGSPGEYGIWPAIIDAAHQSTGPPRPEVNGSAPFTAKSFVDDGVLIEAVMGARLDYAAESYSRYLVACLGEGAVNEKKMSEEGAWEAEKTNWGVVFNVSGVATGGIGAARLKLPSTKLQKACAFMSLAVWRPGNRVVTTKEVQKLSGNVLFWSVVAFPLRLVLNAIWAMTSGGSTSLWAKPAGNPEEQEQAWQDFEMAVEFVKLLVLQRDQWEVTFTSPMTFALDPQELLRMPGGPQNIFINGDASGSEEQNGDVVAAIDLEAGTWNAAHMDDFAGSLGRVCGPADQQDGFTAAEFIIFVKELTALTALVAQHGHLWVNKLVSAAWDNMNVVRVVETRRSKNRYVRYLLAVITRLEIQHKFSVIAFYINTHHNHPADDISRMYGKWLKEDRKSAVSKMQVYLNKNPRWRALKHEPLDALLSFLTDEKHALKSFALPDEAQNPNCVAYQLAQARMTGNPTGVEAAGKHWLKLPSEVAVVEIRAGLGQLSRAAKNAGARILGLVEHDPAARDILRRLFPEANVVTLLGDLNGLIGLKAEQLIVFATFPRFPQGLEGDNLVQAARLNPTIMIVMALGEYAGIDADIRELDVKLSDSGYRRAHEAWWIKATLCGAAHDQQVCVLSYESQSFAKVLGTRARPEEMVSIQTPGRLRDYLRAAEDVPCSSSLGGRLMGGRGFSVNPTSPLKVGTITLGGKKARLFPGSVVKLRGDRTRKWRVLRVSEAEGLSVAAVGSGGAQSVSVADVKLQLVQKLNVFSIDGPGNALQVAAASMAGPGGTIILDDRIGPNFHRALFDDECMRVQGHQSEVADTVQALLPNSPEHRAGLAGRGVAVAVAKTVVERVAQDLTAVRANPSAAPVTTTKFGPNRYGGGPQYLKEAVLRAGSAGAVALAHAEAELFRGQLAAGSHAAYDRGFRYWWVWRTWRGRDPFLRGGSQAFEDESELISFYAYFGMICLYAYSTLHVWLHGIQHAHIIQGLGDPLHGKLRLALVRKGLKRLDKQRRGTTNKLAATVDLLLEVLERGGLDFDSWDDTVLATALIFGFFKLRRCGEFLRSGAQPDADKCVRVGDCSLACKGTAVECTPDGADIADELIAVQRRSKADQEGKGAITSTFSSSDERLCVVAWFKRLIRLRPNHFKDPTRFLFTLSDGKVLDREKVAKVLKAGAVRLGQPSDAISVISLRAGGASSMYHAGFRTDEIQRRGRWASDAYKVYLHDGRDRARDVAERMAKSGFILFL